MSPTQILYGAALSALVSVALVAFAGRSRKLTILATCALAAFLMPIAWNTILRLTGATDAMSRDLPLRILPISWQDTGTAIFTLAGAATALALGPCRRQPSTHTAALALWTALGVLLVDIYAY
jgi:hypothetical protein